MSDLEDLEMKSITEMGNDEALELLRQIRLSRRAPMKVTKATVTKARAKVTTKVSDDQAAELLKLLTGE
jgi:hypothetical protein